MESEPPDSHRHLALEELHCCGSFAGHDHLQDVQPLVLAQSWSVSVPQSFPNVYSFEGEGFTLESEPPDWHRHFALEELHYCGSLVGQDQLQDVQPLTRPQS